MLPIPASLKAILFAILVGAVAFLHSIGPLEPTWTWVGAVAQLLAGLELLVSVPPVAMLTGGARARLVAFAAKVARPLVSVAVLLLASTATAFLALVMAVVALGSSGCGAGGKVEVPPQVVDTGICIVGVISVDLLEGIGLPAAEQDAASKCLSGGVAPTPAQLAAVDKMWTAHLAAEDRERQAAAKDGGTK